MTSLQSSEWLVTDGLGGFAMGTVDGVRTRRYHGLWTHALHPPGDRFLILSGIEAGFVTAQGEAVRLSSQKYFPDVLCDRQNADLIFFQAKPFPQWVFRSSQGFEVTYRIAMERGKSGVSLHWSFSKKSPGAIFWVRPLFAFRDFHSLQKENHFVHQQVRETSEGIAWKPYGDRPEIEMRSTGVFSHDPVWYRQFQYDEEKDRGLEGNEDLHSPGVFQWSLETGEMDLEFGIAGEKRLTIPSKAFKSEDDFLVTRGKGYTLIAGYPWFGDWGRDTFIAMRGMLIGQDRFQESKSILVEWATFVDQGMMPNRFPDTGSAPEYNSVDASLWYVVVVGEFLDRWAKKISTTELSLLKEACLKILEGYAQGTRYQISMKEDGLIACGVPGVQLTWMDAKVGDWVVTPRIGKPVEIQALWIHALSVGKQWEKKWEKVEKRALKSFREKFWNEKMLFDVIDVNHQEGVCDASIRPNMLLAVGGLPKMLLTASRAKKVLDVVEKELWTIAGLRSLSSDHPDYRVRYEGGIWERDGAYHQGTVWVWWIGPFIEAWLRVYGEDASTKKEVKRRFLEPLMKHLDPLNQMHFPEIADGVAPHQARGCPFQAWSLGEVLRAQSLLE